MRWRSALRPASSDFVGDSPGVVGCRRLNIACSASPAWMRSNGLHAQVMHAQVPPTNDHGPTPTAHDPMSLLSAPCPKSAYTIL